VSVDQLLFLEAMRQFPTGVTIVTTVDRDGRQWGFTASSFASLSLQPPLVLACLDSAANCHPSFSSADRFAVNILGAEHEGLARHFATKMVDKFGGWHFDTGDLRLPLVPDAVATLECRTAGRLPGGDHTILVGEPKSIRLRRGSSPAVFYDHRFWRLSNTTVGASAKLRS
jgi:flavin reductase ActVB